MLNVLIIEDEPAIAETLIYAFKEMGIQATHRLLGGDALTELNKAPYDFVLLDVGLPDISGFDVCKKIREFSQIPILFLTARNHEIDRIVGLEIGADDYVIKPFSPREVVTRVKAILRRIENHRAPASRTKNITHFVIDELANRIQYQDQFLELTRYEFLLLKTLIRQPQRVFSRDQLMDTVWANAENTLERTVDAHIKTLRAKLRLIDADSVAIVTHRGMGYSLLA
ncbi:MAG: two-component system response regulator CreB [Betaproteobacteria bacterium HGW-Betaproteobacteria-22]|nr:MAG: two-component system response regulator CreB [Betaproteobacteria bacterium HGW-Betaproteobacteria-22]